MTSTGPERVIGSRSKAGKSECHAVHLVPFWCPTGHSMFTEDPRRNTKTEIYNNTFLHTEYEGRPSHYIKDIINGVDRSCFVVAEQPVQVTVCIANI